MDSKFIDRSRKYHFVILAAAILILIFGSMYRNHLRSKQTSEAPRPETALLSEVQQLRLAFQSRGRIQEDLIRIGDQKMPAVVSVIPSFSEDAERPEVSVFSDAQDPFAIPLRGKPDPPSFSGVVVDPEGHILTGLNASRYPGPYTVLFHDNTRGSAELISSSNEEKLCLLKLKSAIPGEIKTLAQSPKPAVGDWLITIGRSPTSENLVSLGMLSLLQRDRAGRETLYLDCQVVSEQDGGAVLDRQGALAGVYVFISPQRGVCVPSQRALDVAYRLKQRGPVRKESWVGWQLQDPDDSLKNYFGTDTGVLVSNIYPDSPAEQSGLQIGDLIIRANGASVASSLLLIRDVSAASPGREFILHVMRGNEEKEITLKTVPAQSIVPSENDSGLELSDFLKPSELAEMALPSGARIVQVNRKIIRNKSDFLHSQRGRPEMQLWLLSQNGTRFFVAREKSAK